MRKALNGMKSDEAVEQIWNMFARTANNAEFVQMVKKRNCNVHKKHRAEYYLGLVLEIFINNTFLITPCYNQ